MELFKLMGSILVDNDKADKSIQKTGKKADGLGTKLGKGIKTAAKWGAGLAAGAGVAIGGMVALGVKVGNTADEILDLNSVTGMTTDEIQRWRKATEEAGVSTDAVADASFKLTKSLDSMSEESHKGNAALDALGLSLSEVENMSADERMNVLTEALAGVEDETERAQIGTDLFGGSWKELAPVVDMGAEAMENAKSKANIISEDDLQKANDFRIKVEDMKEQIGFFVTEIGIKLLPILSEMGTWIQDKMPTIESVMSNAFDVAGDAIKNVADFVTINILPTLKDLFTLITDNKDKIEVVLTEALNILKTAFDGLKTAVDFVIENMDILLPIIIGVTAAVAAQMIINSLNKAYKTWQAVTKTQTTLQWLLNAALNANPLGLVAIAIGAVIAIGILLYKNWDTIRVKLGEFWSYVKDVFLRMRDWIIGKWNDVLDFFGGLKEKLTSKARGMWDGIKDSFRSAINWIIGKWNDLRLKIGGQKIELPFGKSFDIPSITLNTPNIPMLAKGGDVTGSGRVLVGEQGPEFLDLPKGARVTPLDKGGGGITQNITINSPQELSASEIKRKQLQASRQLAMEWGM